MILNHMRNQWNDAVQGADPGSDVVGSYARLTRQDQANSEGSLGTSALGPHEKGHQIPPPTEFQPHPGGSGKHGMVQEHMFQLVRLLVEPQIQEEQVGFGY